MRPVIRVEGHALGRDIRIRTLQAWWRFSRPMTLGVRGMVLRADGQILLVRHTYTPGWHFPGGGVEKGETCVAALGRELIEEAGIVAEQPPLLMSVHANHRSFPNDHVLFYRVDRWMQQTPTSRGEIAETCFFDPKDPPADTTPGTLRRLAEVFSGRGVAPEW